MKTQQKVVYDEVNINQLHSRQRQLQAWQTIYEHMEEAIVDFKTAIAKPTLAGVGRLHRTTETRAQLRILFATNVISKVTTPDTAKPNARLTR